VLGTLGVAGALPEVSALFGGGLLVPIALVFAYAQYRGTFHHSDTAAEVAGWMWYMLGVWLMLIGGLPLAGAWADGLSLPDIGATVLLLVALAAICFTVGTMNRRWSRRLRDDARRQQAPPASQPFRPREFLVAVALVMLLGILAAWTRG
jgi:uncharacterized membrane protein